MNAIEHLDFIESVLNKDNATDIERQYALQSVKEVKQYVDEQEYVKKDYKEVLNSLCGKFVYADTDSIKVMGFRDLDYKLYQIEQNEDIIRTKTDFFLFKKGCRYILTTPSWPKPVCVEWVVDRNQDRYLTRYDDEVIDTISRVVDILNFIEEMEQ